MAKSNKRDGVIVALIAVMMFGVAFAAYPLYSVFCRVTGYGGAPDVVKKGESVAMSNVAAGEIGVRFNTDVDRDLPWKFRAEKTTSVEPIGKELIAYFVTENTSDETITGVAGFNVAPFLAASYVDKIECFCFTEQTLKPGEIKRMPVTFIIDPDLKTDPDLKEINQLTLSYTFHRSLKKQK